MTSHRMVLRHYASLGLGLATLAACGGQAGSRASTTEVATEIGGHAWRDVDSSLAERMRDTARRMADADIPLGPIEGRGFLTSREHRTHAIIVPAHSCVTIVGLASRGIRDLDVSLFSPEGDALAEDVEPDPHPTIQVCAEDQARDLYYVVTAYDGAGSYLFVSFIGGEESFASAAAIVGGRPGVASGATAERQDARLREITQGVARRGFRPGADPVAVPLDVDQRVRVPLSVQRAHCYAIFALTGPGLSDLDLRLLDELDQELARDVSPATDPGVQMCAERDAELTIEVHAAAGRGVTRIATYEAPVASSGGNSGLWLGVRRATLLSAAPLQQTSARELDRQTELGWTRQRRLANGELTQREVVSHPVVLGGGSCARLLASGGAGIGSLTLSLVDAEGRVLSSRVGHETVTATVCSEGRTRARAHVGSRRGGGRYALHVLMRSTPADVTREVPPAARGAVLDAVSDAHRRGYSLSSLTREVGTATVPVPTQPNQCRHVRVISTGARGVQAQVRRGARIEAREAGAAVELLVCPKAGPSAALEVIPGTPGGGALVLLFDR